jgi:hypothetical protein
MSHLVTTLIILAICVIIFLPLLVGGVDAFTDDSENDWPDGEDEEGGVEVEIPEDD